MPLRVDDDAVELEVAVRNARLVGRLQPVKHLHHERHGVVGTASPLLRKVFGQRAAGHVLVHNVSLGALHLHFEHRHDVGMHEAHGLAHCLEPPLPRQQRLLRPRRQQVEHHVALQTRIKSQPGGGLCPVPELGFQHMAAHQRGAFFTAAERPSSGCGKRGKIGHGAGIKSGPHTV